ncbi:MAG: HAD-IIB family hydrolase [Myxococcaceae bacterium]
MRPNAPLPLAKARLERVNLVLADVDGTLTSKGKLTSSVVRALEWLSAHKVKVALVSGRPSGWAECWARQLPVEGVIAENGGLYFAWRGDKLAKVYLEPERERVRNRERLTREVEAVMKKVPGARLSMDSAATEVDLAIDHNEDVKLGPKAAGRLEQLLRARGVKAVRSSVHVNCWLGDFDKRSAAAAFVRRELSMNLAKKDGRIVFVGDSFNDAPMFEAVPLSVGVANVLDVLGQIDAAPKFVTRAREGKGFIELADAIGRARRAR